MRFLTRRTKKQASVFRSTTISSTSSSNCKKATRVKWNRPFATRLSVQSTPSKTLMQWRKTGRALKTSTNGRAKRASIFGQNSQIWKDAPQNISKRGKKQNRESAPTWPSRLLSFRKDKRNSSRKRWIFRKDFRMSWNKDIQQSRNREKMTSWLYRGIFVRTN